MTPEPGAPPPSAPTTLAQAIGGVRGLVDSGLPTVVFITVATVAELRTAVIAALAVAGLLAGFRLLRREPLQYALSGCLGVAISAFVAVRLGKAEGFFLPGIAVNAAYGAAFLASIAVRRPLVGIIVRALGRPVPNGRIADLTTALWAAVFLTRAAVQGALYLAGQPGWLAAVRIGMGWPLTLGALALTAVVIRRSGAEPAGQNSVGVPDSSPRSPS